MLIARLMRSYRELMVHRILVRYLRESMLEENASDIADRLIASCRLFKPEVLDGHGHVDGYGYAQSEPHRLVSAAMVLESGFDLYKDEPEIRACVLITLRKIFEAFWSRGNGYIYSAQDCARMTYVLQSVHSEEYLRDNA